jgi:hypothetical protein
MTEIQVQTESFITGSWSVSVRTTGDVIEELILESEGGVACLIVRFKNTSLFVFSSGDDPAGELNEMIENGGNPVGIMQLVKRNGSVLISVRPLEEFSGDHSIRGYLSTLAETFREKLGPFLSGDSIR